MNDRRDLLGPLRGANQALSRVTLSPEARQRIAADLVQANRRGAGRRSARLVPAAALLLAAAAVVILSMRDDRTARSRPDRPAQVRAGGFSWEESCAADERAGSLSLDGGCHVRVEEIEMSISSRSRTEIARVDDGVRLTRGKAEFQLASRRDRKPVRVWVSAGAIEVTGTRFVVEQHASGGHVDLLEGTIRFRTSDGTVTAIGQGTRFVWTDPADATPSEPALPDLPPSVPSPSVPSPSVPSPSVPSPSVPPPSVPPPSVPPPSVPSLPRIVPPGDSPVHTELAAPSSDATSAERTPAAAATVDGLLTQDTADLLERIHSLRAQRRYREAAELIGARGARSRDPVADEILSFEQGDILEHLGENRATCQHWRAHQARFPGGRYREPIRRALARLRCP